MVDYVISRGFDMFALTVARLGNDSDQLVVSKLVPSDYEFKHFPWANQNHGGVIDINYRF